ncbi:putative ferredoxin [Mycolicibacterium thermoresistibile ATCC 19527]|uniref:Putative ferredoxin n=3 Tax=Mycolicibacterium thermoresistibile TaxID=1797 RepID=G7CJ86_MYCT3|nr:putative ferredoxin [Mycolicibacterium thermoresistibile ATCC 19527]MCV7190055.1 ferredoxin [Mycolicibacterium thermoresistibile]GAT13888.1 putative ferredoxin [Mycolicibacterium thermoresistibile]SNW19061.1 putative Ferredoxin [Mycolicibacterium thermoresistibile]
MKKISVDIEYCQAHGRCYALFPDLFDAQEDGTAVVKGDGELPDSIDPADVTGSCPEAAITVG